ncbi:hypothetical protein Nmel_013363 [Mimus melanotis]
MLPRELSITHVIITRKRKVFMNWHRSSSHAAPWCGSPEVGTTFGTAPNPHGASCPPSMGSAGTRPIHFPLKTLKTAWLGVGHMQETLKFIL